MPVPVFQTSPNSLTSSINSLKIFIPVPVFQTSLNSLILSINCLKISMPVPVFQTSPNSLTSSINSLKIFMPVPVFQTSINSLISSILFKELHVRVKACRPGLVAGYLTTLARVGPAFEARLKMQNCFSKSTPVQTCQSVTSTCTTLTLIGGHPGCLSTREGLTTSGMVADK